jgi:hypothetical protein
MFYGVLCYLTIYAFAEAEVLRQQQQNQLTKLPIIYRNRSVVTQSSVPLRFPIILALPTFKHSYVEHQNSELDQRTCERPILYSR